MERVRLVGSARATLTIANQLIQSRWEISEHLAGDTPAAPALGDGEVDGAGHAASNDPLAVVER